MSQIFETTIVTNSNLKKCKLHEVLFQLQYTVIRRAKFYVGINFSEYKIF
jgi:hypothetical protein